MLLEDNEGWRCGRDFRADSPKKALGSRQEWESEFLQRHGRRSLSPGRASDFGMLDAGKLDFFGTITGFASAISGTIICWTLPYIFALKVGDLTSFEAASMKALVPVTIIIAVVGVVATVMDMINKIGDQKGAPFGCSSN